MNNEAREVGYLTYDILKETVRLPAKERLAKGPVAIIECTEDIPCDPCVEACKSGAISKESLVTPPSIDYEKCTGCTLCIDLCPGLAIFVVNINYKEDKALVSIPYEMLPVPEKGDIVDALNRSGENIGQAEVIKTRKGKSGTHVISIAVDRKFAMETRSIKVKRKENEY
ncbi:MAG: 4Fe-4S binding protein [Dehalococcoidia bacterium]|nr:4Fe-4S binding protein [Dehalococcoidia bacterium]